MLSLTKAKNDEGGAARPKATQRISKEDYKKFNCIDTNYKIKQISGKYTDRALQTSYPFKDYYTQANSGQDNDTPIVRRSNSTSSIDVIEQELKYFTMDKKEKQGVLSKIQAFSKQDKQQQVVQDKKQDIPRATSIEQQYAKARINIYKTNRSKFDDVQEAQNGMAKLQLAPKSPGSVIASEKLRLPIKRQPELVRVKSPTPQRAFSPVDNQVFKYDSKTVQQLQNKPQLPAKPELQTIRSAPPFPMQTNVDAKQRMRQSVREYYDKQMEKIRYEEEQGYLEYMDRMAMYGYYQPPMTPVLARHSSLRYARPPGSEVSAIYRNPSLHQEPLYAQVNRPRPRPAARMSVSGPVYAPEPYQYYQDQPDYGGDILMDPRTGRLVRVPYPVDYYSVPAYNGTIPAPARSSIQSNGGRIMVQPRNEYVRLTRNDAPQPFVRQSLQRASGSMLPRRTVHSAYLPSNQALVQIPAKPERRISVSRF